MNKSFDEFMNLSVKEFYQITTDYKKTYNLLKICRTYNYYHFGYYVGKLLENVNNWEFLDELSICAYWIGEYQESYDLCKKIIFMCPEEEKDRIIENKSFSAKKLGIKEVFNLEDFKQQSKEEISKLDYKKYFYQFNEQEKEGLATEIKETEIYFKKVLDLEIYPVYGTLLGMMRENDFIGHDTDIDLAYLSKYHTNEEVIKEFNEICKSLEKDQLLLTRIKTMSHLHIYSPSKKLRTDLWISWIDYDGNYHLVWSVNGDIDASMILPFKTVTFKKQTFRQMNDPIRFLDEHYSNWRVPLDGTAEQWAKRKPRFELEPWHGK